MNSTLKYIAGKYNFDLESSSPISLDDTRNGLAILFKELGYKVGAEIGVDRGLYSKELSKANPGVKLYCIDPWKVYKEYDDIPDQHTLNVNYNSTIKCLAPYNCKIIRKFSMGAINDFEDRSLDFVYIDGNHTFNYVLEDINQWSKKVKPGGIVSGHDYIWRSHQRRAGFDVKKALELHLQNDKTTQLFLLTKKGSSSWFYIK